MQQTCGQKKRASTVNDKRHLSIIVRRDGTPFASRETLIHFADAAALESFIEEHGKDLDLAGHAVWHERETPELKIVWEFWRTAGMQSDFHRREIGIVDLGEIS